MDTLYSTEELLKNVRLMREAFQPFNRYERFFMREIDKEEITKRIYSSLGCSEDKPKVELPVMHRIIHKSMIGILTIPVATPAHIQEHLDLLKDDIVIINDTTEYNKLFGGLKKWNLKK